MIPQCRFEEQWVEQCGTTEAVLRGTFVRYSLYQQSVLACDAGVRARRRDNRRTGEDARDWKPKNPLDLLRVESLCLGRR